MDQPEQLTYEQVTEVLKEPGIVLVDVRGQDEVKNDGKIANSKNIPVTEIGDALQLDDAAFKKKYGFNKPKVDDEIVVHCKLGARANKGATAMIEAGFTNVKVYSGMNDWVSHGGPLVK